MRRNTLTLLRPMLTILTFSRSQVTLGNVVLTALRSATFVVR